MKLLKVSPYSKKAPIPGSLAQPGDTVLIKFRDETIQLTYGKDKLWRSIDGCVYGFVDPRSMTDPIVRCGVGALSLPDDSPLNDACRAHDFMYSCPAYQINHTREEADKILRDHIELVGRGHWYGKLAYPFFVLVRLFGGKFWENEKTNI